MTENDKLKWKTVEDNSYKIKIWFLKDIEKYEKQLNLGE